MSEHIIVDRTTTWHSIGKSVEECRNMEQVLTLSGLDYEVTKEPIYQLSDGGIYTPIPNRFITVNSNGKSYDVVSDKFTVVQNRSAFSFVDYMGDEVAFNKAGETTNGMVYIIASLPEVDILGDSFIPHVIFRNGFSGKTKITAAICPLRMVCQNQFNFAFKHTQNAITIRHVQNAEQKLEEAREVLRMSADYMTRLNAEAQKYVGVKLSERELEAVLNIMFPMKDVESMNAFKRHKMEEARAKFANAYNADDNWNFRGTAWGMINAYTDFITHKAPEGKTTTKEEGKFMAVTFNPALMNSIIEALSVVCVAA